MTQGTTTTPWLLSPLRLVMWTGLPLLVLLVPLVAMQFTEAVDWDATDFTLMGILLGGAGLIYGLATRQLVRLQTRLMIGAAVLALTLLLWADAAVGVIGLLGGS